MAPCWQSRCLSVGNLHRCWRGTFLAEDPREVSLKMLNCHLVNYGKETGRGAESLTALHTALVDTTRCLRGYRVGLSGTGAANLRDRGDNTCSHESTVSASSFHFNHPSMELSDATPSLFLDVSSLETLKTNSFRQVHHFFEGEPSANRLGADRGISCSVTVNDRMKEVCLCVCILCVLFISKVWGAL